MKWMISDAIIMIAILTIISPVMAASEIPNNSNKPQLLATVANEKTTYTFSQLSGLSGFFLKGSSASKEFYVPVLREWDLDSVTLHFIVTRAALFSKSTTLTLYANNSPIDSIELSGISISKNWDVNVPASAVKNSLINITLTSVTNDVELSCANLINPSYWVYVSGDSTVAYHYKNQDYHPNLSAFPFPFIHDPSITADTVLMVLPDSPSLKNMSSAFNIANTLGNKATWRGIKIENAAISAIPEDKKANMNIIFIGTAKELALNSISQHLPLPIDNEGQILDKNNQKLNNDIGVIMLLPSPYNPKYAMLAVTGNSDEAVYKSALMLRNPNFSNSVLFNEYALATNKEEINSARPRWSETDLKTLGFGNQTVYAGAGDNVLDDTIDLPQDKKIRGLSLSVKYLVSTFLSSADTPYLTIQVNGTPVGGTALDLKNDNIKTWNFYIDGSNFVPGKNHLAFNFYIRLRPMNCNPQTLNLAWATLYSSTGLHIDIENKDMFLNFRTFTTMDGNLTIAIPASQPFFKSVDFIGKLMDLGKLMQQVAYVDFVDSSHLTADSVNNSHVLYFGEMNSNMTLASHKSLIPFYFENNQLHVDPVLLPVLAISSETPLVITELLPSIFNSKNLMLLIMARNDQGYLLGTDLLTNERKNGLINGNIVFTYENGTFNSIQSQKMAQLAEKGKKINHIVNLIVYSIGILIIAVVFYLIFRVVRRQIKYYFSKNHDEK